MSDGYTVTEVRPVRRRGGRYKMVCGNEGCGSENITGVAYVRWDVELQRWEFDDWYGDDDWCNDCQSETTAEDIVIEDDAS